MGNLQSQGPLVGTPSSVTAERMSSMLAAIVRGMTLDEARGTLVTSDEETQIWRRLENDVREIHARGGIVEIPVVSFP